MSRLLVALLWLLHWLPLAVLAPLGEALGLLLYRVVSARRKVVLTNLRHCFPEWTEGECQQVARKHFRLLGRSLFERGLLWWAPRERLERIIRITGTERVQALLDAGTPVILMAPHFVGLDMGGTRVTMAFDIVSIYARQSDKVIDRWLYHGRSRFGDQRLLPRDESIRSTVRAMKAGRPFYYLPDMDHGRKESIFVPFFGIATATITGLPRFARMAGAAVVPCQTRMLPGGAGYEVTLGEPWTDYPSGDVAADVTRMNAEIERMVLAAPEQYYWVHRRFKTRPEGERRFY
ncbi:MAG: lipid A biosynthesis acyltransferase [Zoogloeaceae bacterium]|uniref:lysophospholipid acyltransferase family protein n=1 Tax=Denitromonas sp. TaxID=2734609 RepID=UPI001D449437|nr:lipid A biosynthesis acyltransferase [Rhodocyclaceae bacterium]MCP5222489.1 lipid A biosynthesis acyltransferase [Zoogloeaceae bacterium]HQU89064.1 lipid A biosynthesis acyltransferase [Denitromonas sp.]